MVDDQLVARHGEVERRRLGVEEAERLRRNVLREDDECLCTTG